MIQLLEICATCNNTSNLEEMTNVLDLGKHAYVCEKCWREN